MYITCNILLGLILCWSTAKAATKPHKPKVIIAQAQIKKADVEVSVQFVVSEKDPDVPNVFIHYIGLAPNRKFDYDIHEPFGYDTYFNPSAIWNPTHWLKPCEPTLPSNCKSGALSTKHGPLMGHGSGPKQTVVSYHDAGLKFNDSHPGFLYQSFVIRDSTDETAPFAFATIEPSK